MSKYEIGGKVYEQKTLVWGQLQQLVGVLKGIEFPAELSATTLFDILGDKIPLALAVVLTEEGKSPKDKDINAFAEELENTIPIDVAIQVIEDFFVCNPTASIFKKLTGMLEKINQPLEETKTSLKKSESTSPEETSPATT